MKQDNPCFLIRSPLNLGQNTLSDRKEEKEWYPKFAGPSKS